MPTANANRRKPAITLTQSDHAKLSRLVDGLPEGPVTEELALELDRAKVVADKSASETLVRLGTRLTYSTDAGDSRTVTLVFPGEADIEQGRISILTPIGVALIGLTAGQSIDWTARDGHRHRLTVDAVDGAPQPLQAAAS